MKIKLLIESTFFEKNIRTTAWNKIIGWNRKQIIKSICHYLNTQLLDTILKLINQE